MKRHADHPINPLFINRWSSRAMSGKSVSNAVLMSLFEASRWAPSSYNGQPWRFIYAHRDTRQWDILFNLLVPFNQEWAKNAAVLMVIISCNNFEFNGKFSRTHSFDAGAAWQNMALQAYTIGLIAHGIEGFDYDAARKDLDIPDDYTIEAMVAVGKPGEMEVLSPEMQKKEVQSGRKKVEEFIFEGTFKQK